MKDSESYPRTILVVMSTLVTTLIFSPFISQHQVFAVPQKINLDLKVDTSTLKFTDVNGSKTPRPGDFTSILGKLYTPGTQNEVGTYRCTFGWGGSMNSTAGVPVSIATQVFDIKGNGTIVAVGDEPGEGPGAMGKPVAAVIAGGTDSYKGISSGVATLTLKGGMEQKLIPFDVVLDFERP
jgi:hypothetical protein